MLRGDCANDKVVNRATAQWLLRVRDIRGYKVRPTRMRDDPESKILGDVLWRVKQRSLGSEVKSLPVVPNQHLHNGNGMQKAIDPALEARIRRCANSLLMRGRSDKGCCRRDGGGRGQWSISYIIRYQMRLLSSIDIVDERLVDIFA